MPATVVLTSRVVQQNHQQLRDARLHEIDAVTKKLEDERARRDRKIFSVKFGEPRTWTFKGGRIRASYVSAAQSIVTVKGEQLFTPRSDLC
jgi:hypothetical protein